MPTVFLAGLVALDNRLALGAAHANVTRDRGEGVISTAIAILIMAFLGTIMWFGFQSTMKDAQKNTDVQVSRIGK